MAGASEIQSLANFLECNICLEKYDDPKLLACSHQFCRRCLDKLLCFNEDGSASITCPNRCEERTVVGKHETTNNLRKCYDFKGILDALHGNDNGLDSSATACSYTNGCSNDVVVYCCGTRMCRTCNIKHEEDTRKHAGKTGVFHDKREKTLKVLCEEHLAPCTHLCYDDEFVCTYCMHRSHEGHRNDTIQNQAEKLRESLENELKKLVNSEEMRKLSGESIRECEMKIEQTLRERKISCLWNYLKLLEKEEQMIREKFQNVCNEHMQRYQFINPATYYQAKLEKSDTELTIEKRAILEKLVRPPLRRVTVSLGENFGCNKAHPLGDLQVRFSADTAASYAVAPSTFNDDITPVSCYESILSNFTMKVEDLLKDNATKEQSSNVISSSINKAEQSDSTSEVEASSASCVEVSSSHVLVGGGECADGKNAGSCYYPSTEEILRKEDILNECTKHLENRGFSYIENLIQTKENEKLKLLLHGRPDILLMRDTEGDTPFHHAAYFDNVEAMGILVEHGASIHAVNRDGYTALHWATVMTNIECLQWLLQNCVTLTNVKADDGTTPLHIAAKSCSVAALKLLLTYGAEVEAKTNMGDTALQLAQKGGKEEIVKELQEWAPENGDDRYFGE